MFTVLQGKSLRKQQHGRSRKKFKDNIKIETQINRLRGYEVDSSGSGSHPMADFYISCVEQNSPYYYLVNVVY